MRALDVGCGPGALAAELAALLGPGAVTAIDPSAPFAAACAARLPEVEVVVGSAEALPFADATFDAVLSQLVVNFMGDAQAGVREMARVARPGGVVASCVWDYAGEMTLLRAFWDAAHRDRPGRRRGGRRGRGHEWCRDGELAELWHAAGLRDIRSDAFVVRASYTGFEDLWAPLPTGVGPAGAFCAALTTSAAVRCTTRFATASASATSRSS